MVSFPSVCVCRASVAHASELVEGEVVALVVSLAVSSSSAGEQALTRAARDSTAARTGRDMRRLMGVMLQIVGLASTDGGAGGRERSYVMRSPSRGGISPAGHGAAGGYSCRTASVW